MFLTLSTICSIVSALQVRPSDSATRLRWSCEAAVCW
jgi:hypothetical protein